MLEVGTFCLILNLNENAMPLGCGFVRYTAYGGDHAETAVSRQHVKVDSCQSLPARSLRYCINNGTGLPVPPFGAPRKPCRQYRDVPTYSSARIGERNRQP